MKFAALDLGTNTSLLLIVETQGGGQPPRVLCDEVRITRLGQEVQSTRRLHPEALQRAADCFAEFKALIDHHQVNIVRACTTSAARDAVNGQDFIQLGARYGIPIEIISGEREAALTFLGSLESAKQEWTAVIDVGGGSTEIVIGDTKGPCERVSLNVGSVRLTEKFITGHPISAEELERLIQFVRQEVSRALDQFNLIPAQVLLVAGTPTTLASVELGRAFESELVHGHRMELSTLERWVHRLAGMSIEERKQLGGMEPKRADVIVAGAVCLMEALRGLQQTEARVSIRGLRYGIAMDLIASQFGPSGASR